MNTLVDDIRPAVHGRHPLIYLCTPEERRALDALRALAAEMPGGGHVTTWTCLAGLSGDTSGATRDPVAALQSIVRSPRPGFYVMTDLSEFITRPEVVRALRDTYQAFLSTPNHHVAILSPRLVVPDLLEKEIFRIELPLPTPPELLDRVLAVEAEYPGAAIPEAVRPAVTLALRGLTLEETAHVMHRVFGAGTVGESDILNQIFLEKKMLLRKEGFLHYVPTTLDMSSVGGMDVLRDWAVKRKNLFTQESYDAGLPVPKGVLIMGVSGCGKSLSAKAIASLWRVPLFRLDMNLVFSGLYGSAEAAFQRALDAIESVAPAVLWIDEIENALGMTAQSATVAQSLTFSSFLTWMQERPPLVFVAATANRIESLPAEVLRKGRFDEVFFCDLPSDDERREIIRIHLKLNGVPEGTVDADRLLHSTEGWTGAEIEQAIVSARIDALQEGRAPGLEDIRRHTVRMVPLSTTMAEQIRAIRNWAFNRALRASRERPRSMVPDR